MQSVRLGSVRMRMLAGVCFCCLTLAPLAKPQVRVGRSAGGWIIENGRIRLELVRTASGGLLLGSLRNVLTGYDWAAVRTPTGVFLQGSQQGIPGTEDIPGFRVSDDQTRELAGGGKELAISFTDSATQARLWLFLRCYPSVAVIEYAARLQNSGSETLPLLFRIDPLCLYLKKKGGELRLYTAELGVGPHGFLSTRPLAGKSEFKNWVVFEDPTQRESLLIGGDLGANVLQWKVNTEQRSEGTFLRAGVDFRPYTKSDAPPAYEVARGQSVETPIGFLALAGGDPDDAGNEAFRYLKRFVLPKPVPNSPLVTYCIWYTHPNSEELLLEELKFARQVGFDVFYHDASWYEDSSLVPGMNDWSKGLGSYREDRAKFPGGMKAFSDAVRAAGMKFGIWVDPGNVDSTRVSSGEIPKSWLASIDGKVLGGEIHPSLAPMTQLCLGNPEVVRWVKDNLSRIIDSWNLEWLKWDPSGTVSYACNRTDHGHGRFDGAYAAYRGKIETWSYLNRRFPELSGFETKGSLHYSRTNPGPQNLMPGGYVNEFMTGLMVSPFVWGSLASCGVGDSSACVDDPWFSASALDYHLRKHFTHGVSFGNINGMMAQRLSAAPAGYIEAFKRNLLNFKQYRHLLLEDVYHPKPAVPEGWSALEYVKPDASEAVLFVFRDRSQAAENRVKLRGLEPQANYLVTSLNERPGRDRTIAGQELMAKGLKIQLPNQWLVRGDGFPAKKYEDQLHYGSDVILLRRLVKH